MSSHTQELRYLNLAINNITLIEGLDRCESLQKLDLTLNFVPVEHLSSVSTLLHCYDLRELSLMGNPCCQWSGYRKYVIGTLQSLKCLDSFHISCKERDGALLSLPALKDELKALSERKCPEDPEIANQFHSTTSNDNDEKLNVRSNGQLVSSQGEHVGWCPAARFSHWKEMEQREQEKASCLEINSDFSSLENLHQSYPRTKHKSLPPLDPDTDPLQCNEGKWEYTLHENVEPPMTYAHLGPCMLLSVALEPEIDVHMIEIDIHPRCVRLLARGSLFQLRLLHDVLCDESVAQRSKATGRLNIYMPLCSGPIGTRHVQEAQENLRSNRNQHYHQTRRSSSSASSVLLLPGDCVSKAAITADECRSADWKPYGPHSTDDSDNEECNIPPLYS